MSKDDPKDCLLAPATTFLVSSCRKNGIDIIMKKLYFMYQCIIKIFIMIYYFIFETEGSSSSLKESANKKKKKKKKKKKSSGRQREAAGGSGRQREASPSIHHSVKVVRGNV